jgi:hypothetical protein
VKRSDDFSFSDFLAAFALIPGVPLLIGGVVLLFQRHLGIGLTLALIGVFLWWLALRER